MVVLFGIGFVIGFVFVILGIISLFEFKNTTKEKVEIIIMILCGLVICIVAILWLVGI